MLLYCEVMCENKLIPFDHIQPVKKASETLPIAITPHIAKQINSADPTDPFTRQFVPNLKENTVSGQEMYDPIGDQVFAPVEGIVHRYPDRVLLTPIFSCPVYCRFCFRRETVGSGILKTQSGLFYDYNAAWEIATLEGIGAEVGDSLLIEIRLRYELEWEHDSLYIFYISASNTTELMQLTGDQFDFFTAYIPLLIGEEQGNGNILLRLHSDLNLNYRGVEIDKLVIHKSGNYIGTDLSNSSNLVPDNFVLYQNFPNPFNPTTNIRFSVSAISSISISIYNIRGEWIEKIVNGAYEQGYYTVRFDAREYASGIYLYRMEAENSVHTKKFMIIK